MRESSKGAAPVPAPAWSAAEARAFDRHLQEAGVPAALLMENAACSLAREIREVAAGEGLTRILLICGTGNNGGDAVTAARQLLGSGLSLRLAFPLGPPRPGSLGSAALSALLRLAPELAPDVGERSNFLREADLLVDGLFGLGLDRPLIGPARAAVERILESGLPAIAADLPSGLHADSGEVLGAAVRARRTVTFGGLKAGLTRGAGPACAGEIRVADLGVGRGFAEAWLAARRAAQA